MKNLFFPLLTILLHSCDKDTQPPASAPVTKKYELVWSDEFNTDGTPDPSKWEYDSGFVRNEEAQWYQRQNAACEGGNLVITGKKERVTNPNYIAGSSNWRNNRQYAEYTSACLKMIKTHAFKYGKMEVKAKIDAQTGLWPAIWTLGVEGEWPSNGEVDVMEYYGDKILANFAYASATRWQAIWDGASKTVASLGGSFWASQYHIWTLEWDEVQMRILLDGVEMNTIDVNTTINKSDGKNPFRQPHYILLNLAMGGTNGGSLAATTLPAKYYVDYVRVYQKK